MNSKQLKIFFSGIGGSGISAIAGFMADNGHLIFGSDRAFDNNPNHPLYGLLTAKGITIVPQDGYGVDESFDFAVFSTAIEHNQPELLRAKIIRLPVKTRPEYLAEIVLNFKTIAVAGTSGKSTTSGMLAFLMERLGLKPNFIGGGRVKQFKTNSNSGNSITGNSDLLVIEACESDGTIVNYRPAHSIILNLDFDHHTIDETAKMFEKFINNTMGKVIVNADDDNLRSAFDVGTVDRSQKSEEKIITFSIDGPSHYKAENIIYKPFSADFSLSSAKFSLSIPGKYNLYNALSCIAMLSEMGIPLNDIADVLPEFNGIERRFDIHLNNGKNLVIDDYAHNPHKISSLMQTMKNIKEKICYIFQPHGFAPTLMMKNEYIEAFIENLRNSDHLILLPIFYAGGTINKDISSHDLAKEIISKGKSVEVVNNRKTILDKLSEWDNYVILGARDETLSDFAKDIAKKLKIYF
jgi:UDP-N-acetylmuramate--alanine ligase